MDLERDCFHTAARGGKKYRAVLMSDFFNSAR